METVITGVIQPNDNAVVAIVILKVLVDLGVPKIGTAYAEDHMYENYDVAKAAYFVLEDKGRIIACADITWFGC